MGKKCKVEKETRRLMESMADLVKKKNDGYKFRTKGRKAIKRIKRSCVHWIMRKKEFPTVDKDPNNPMNWKCMICGASFPIRPGTLEEYHKATDDLIANVNQMQFWSVKMGGDADDTKLFIRLKSDLARFKKIQKNILNKVNKREQWEARKANTETLSQFDGYRGYNYRN